MRASTNTATTRSGVLGGFGSVRPTGTSTVGSSSLLGGGVSGGSSATSGPSGGSSALGGGAVGGSGPSASSSEAALVEQRLGIVKRNRALGGAGGGKGDGHGAQAPFPAVTPPCDHYPAFDNTTPLSATSVETVKMLTSEVIDCLFFPDSA